MQNVVPVFFCTSLLRSSLIVALSVLDCYWGSSIITWCSFSQGFLFLFRPLQVPEPVQPRPSWLVIAHLQGLTLSSALGDWQVGCLLFICSSHGLRGHSAFLEGCFCQVLFAGSACLHILDFSLQKSCRVESSLGLKFAKKSVVLWCWVLKCYHKSLEFSPSPGEFHCHKLYQSSCPPAYGLI